MYINKFDNYDNIYELARVNNIKTFPYDVMVNGGDPIHGGRVEHGVPHFHFYDKKIGGKISLSVKIPTIIEWSFKKDLIIIESNNDVYNNWNTLKKERKELIIWLDKKSHIIKTLTNLEYVRLQWNILNKNNTNVNQLKLK